MDYIPLNFAIMKNPYNWIIVTLMVAIAGLGLALLFPQPGGAPVSNEVER